jgi:CheY-like chemotaxis protein
MDGDLLRLKMAVVADDAAQGEVLRQAAAMASAPIDIVALRLGEAARAKELLARGELDMVFLDCDLTPSDRDALAQAARAAKHGTIIVSIAAATSRDGMDADAVLEKPVGRAAAGAMVECCVRARRPTRVLVVDDSPTVRSIVRKMMRASRFSLQTEETSEGAAALDLMRSGRFDIVFLDCDMPGIDGFATLTEIKRSHPRIATVMMTGTPDQSIAVRARKAGAQGLLGKPFFPKDIDAVLHGLFGLNVPGAARA